MRSLFDQYYKYSESELKELWKNAVFFIDANVLLNLYRYPKETSDDLLKIFNKIRKRLWVPFQAALEYQESRRSVIYEQVERFAEVKSVLEEASEFLETKLHELQLDKRHSSIEPKEFVDETKSLFESFSERLDDLEFEQSKKYDNNDLRDQIDRITESRVTTVPINQTSLDEIFNEGEQRYEKQIPPGFKDAGKAKKNVDSEYEYRGLKIKRKFGDLLVWKQIIEKVNELGATEVILITDDTKEDWWWKKSGKTYGPHKALIEEIKAESTVEKFWMYSSLGFVKNAESYLGTKIKENTLDSVEEVVKAKKRKIQKLALPEYYIPILSVLNNSENGELTVQECIERVAPLVEPFLKEDDREPLPSTGELRWENNTKWARNDLRKMGMISSDSPRGIWKITEKGIEYLKNE